MKILVVEDDLSTRVLLKKILERADYVVYEADDGKTALEMAEIPNIDIFLVDVMMPSISGIDFIYHLKQNPITANKPVVLCTSVSNQDIVKKAIALGISGYVVKPITAGALLRTIEKCKKQISPVLESESYTARRLGLDTSEYRDLVTLLVSNAKNQLHTLGGKIEKGDVQQFEQFVNDLSVSAENLGAKRLHNVAREAKIAAPKSDKDLLMKYLFYLKTEIDNLDQMVSKQG